MTEPEHKQEVRLALVLYGGVSLAIYINGVMQEMLQLVRSTSGLPLSSEDGSANVYRKLGAMLGPERKIEDLPLDAPIQTKFMVDVISGTSAGGINGIFLAKALANGAENLNEIQELWFSEGAIESLLNDKPSYLNLPVNQPKETASLLNSRRMYLKLLNAFDGMKPNPDPGAPQLADEIDLFATTTDIEGVPVPIQLFDNVVYERRYRNAFHFRYTRQQQPARNDFEEDNNPFLAFAARCTSSFPFAFEPMRLCNIDEILKSSTRYAKKSYCFSDSARWQKFYTNYLHGIIDTAKPFPQRPFGDGGYLNNAPFSYAVDTLLQRQGAVPVDRKLFYVEPSPSHVEEEAAHEEMPNAIQNSMDALIVIPGYQTIRNDLMRVLERNRQATKINKTLAEVESEIQNDSAKCVTPPKAEGLQEIWFQPDDYYRAYYRMRSAEVTDKIATMLARIYCIDEDSAYFDALRSVVRVWREAIYSVASGTNMPEKNAWKAAWHEEWIHAVPPGTDTAKENDWEDFLEDFDLPYRIRRLRFVLRKLDSLYNLSLPEKHPSRQDALNLLKFGLGEAEATVLPGKAVGLPEGLSKIRADIFAQYGVLNGLLRTLMEPPLPKDEQSPDSRPQADALKEVRKALSDSETLSDSEKKGQQERVIELLAKILGQPEPVANGTSSGRKLLTTKPNARKIDEPADLEKLCDMRALQLAAIDEGLRKKLIAAGLKLKDLLDAELKKIQETLNNSFAESGDAGMIAKRFYHCFDLFDAIQYPMAFNTDIGEADVVQIVRVAPEDATALGPDDVVARRAKLKGLVAAHFGAFLDRDWRVNDLLWGRLDAAERIITALLPWDDPPVLLKRIQLIDEAQSRILQTFDAHERLLDMAIRQAAHDDSQSRVSNKNVESIIDAAVSLAGPDLRDRNRQFMDVWRDIVPPEANRSLMARTLARATTIIGRILETISNEKGVAKKQAAWITNAGRALWGLVEISVPRSLGTLLGKYWQSLLLLIAIILLIAGVISGQKDVSGVGWSLFGIFLALLTIRSIFGSWMRGGNVFRYVRGLIVLVLVILVCFGAHQVYGWGIKAYELAASHVSHWLNLFKIWLNPR
jgi:patatin-related protein